MSNDNIVVSIESVSKSFVKNTPPALDNISATVKAGKITGLVGPDGAGKTTLIRLICGLLKQDQGTIKVNQFESLKESEKIHNLIGYMPQKFGLYEELSVLENLTLYAQLRNVTGMEREKKFEKLLKFTDLARFKTRLARNLSGGMKQKLGLACALIGTPKLLLLDEPSVGVDPISRRELWHMVQELMAKGMAVVWSTAYLDEAEKCDHILLLNLGKSLYHGTPSPFVEKMQNRVFLLSGIPNSIKRQVLAEIKNHPSVSDGVLQGEQIRVVMRQNVDLLHLATPTFRGLSAESIDPADKPRGVGCGVNGQTKWITTPPRFEDAFVDTLGGGGSGKSALAEAMPELPMHQNAVIEAHHLTKCFDDFVAVSDNSFTIKRGEIFGLLGPNGAGKSTTFKMMCGLLQPTKGSAFVMGLDLKKASSKARNRIGYMAQKFSLYTHLTTMQNMYFFSGLYGLSGKKQRQQIKTMVDVFELAPYLNQNTGSLPLGFKQRLALACSVMHQPDVLFLDEPTSGVDPITRREFWTHINGLVEKGVTVMVTTHFMDEAEYCDRIGLVYRGHNIATSTPRELKSKISSTNNPNPTLEDAFITLIKNFDEKQCT